MEQLIYELYDQSKPLPPNRVSEIEKDIQRYQREPSGWIFGRGLLNGDNPHLRCEGALTLPVKINADW